MQTNLFDDEQPEEVTDDQPEEVTDDQAEEVTDDQTEEVTDDEAEQVPAVTGETVKLETPAMPEPTEPSTIYLYDGQRSKVKNSIPPQTVRDYLASTYPHLANAQMEEGREQDGEKVYKTITFVKRAGHKA